MNKILLPIILFFNINTCFSNEWTCINRVIQCNTWKMEVPAGWIVASDNRGIHGDYAMVFVPDEKHEWKIEDERNKV